MITLCGIKYHYCSHRVYEYLLKHLVKEGNKEYPMLDYLIINLLKGFEDYEQTNISKYEMEMFLDLVTLFSILLKQTPIIYEGLNNLLFHLIGNA